MAYWTIKFDSEARKQFKKLDIHSQKLIQNYLNDRILSSSHPKDFGKPLSSNMKGKWRYRVDKFRIVCKIEDRKLIVLVLQIAKRDVVYED